MTKPGRRPGPKRRLRDIGPTRLRNHEAERPAYGSPDDGPDLRRPEEARRLPPAAPRPGSAPSSGPSSATTSVPERRGGPRRVRGGKEAPARLLREEIGRAACRE